MLSEQTIDPNPIEQFRLWLDDARASELAEPDAMTLATASPLCRPSARVVLLRGLDERGFVFFTNYESAKGHELEKNPHAAAVFYWGKLQRQVRIEGSVSKVAPEESDAYFESRPRGHRLSAWASAQSTVIPSREYLESRVASFDSEFAGHDIERPPYWGGYRITPERIEFWQGRPDRLHDRFLFTRSAERWHMERLSP